MTDLLAIMVATQEQEKAKVANAMLKYGGSFVKALGEALLHADPANTLKIKKAFSEYWQKYLEFPEG